MNAVRNVRWQFGGGEPVDDDQRIPANSELQDGAGNNPAAMEPIHHPWLVLHDLDDPADLVPATATGRHVGADQVAVGFGDGAG